MPRRPRTRLVPTFAPLLLIVFLAARCGSDSSSSRSAVPPAAPVNVQAGAPYSLTVNLTWDAPSADEAGFRVYRGDGASPAGFSRIADLGADVTSYADTTVSPGATYVYRVTSFNAAAESAVAQSLPVTSIAFLLGTAVDDFTHSVAVDGAGNVLVAGVTPGSLYGPALGLGDIFLLKLDPSGNPLWGRQFGPAGGTDTQLAVDADGNAFVSGNVGDNLVLVRFDPSGAEVWRTTLGDAVGVSINPFANALGPDNAVYVAGTTSGNFGQVNVGGYDAFIARFDGTDNSLAWVRLLGSENLDIAYGLAVDRSSGAVYVSGMTLGAMPGQVSAGGEDIFLAKYDSAGDRVWVSQFGSAGGVNEIGYAVAVDNVGRVFLAGYTDGNLDSQDINAGPPKSDVFLSRYTAAGVREWTRLYGSPLYDGLYPGLSIAVGPDGSVLVAGDTQGGFAGPNADNNGTTYDPFVLKADPDTGAVVWKTQAGTPDDDTTGGVAVGPDGSVYLVGNTTGSYDARPTAGGQDGFLLKFTEGGVLESVTR